MSKNILIFLFSFLISAGVVYKIMSDQNIIVPQLSFLEPQTKFSIQNAPGESLRGKIVNLSGSVSYESRAANFGLSITSPTDIVQGDSLSTLGNGKAQVLFASIGTILFSSNTQVNFIQTLPQNFVVQQTQGSANYEGVGKIPFTIRSLDLITNLSNNSEVSITVDKDKLTATINIQKGSAVLAYEDLNNTSHVDNLSSGQEAIFDNNTQTLILH